MAFETQWKGHTLRVVGTWSARWLYLAPDYELWLDDQKVDRSGGPVPRPHLEGIFEDDDGQMHHIEATLLSIIGYNPSCDIRVEGDTLARGRVRVDNFLNPFLVIFILAATTVMLYVGPDVLRQYWPGF